MKEAKERKALITNSCKKINDESAANIKIKSRFKKIRLCDNPSCDREATSSVISCDGYELHLCAKCPYTLWDVMKNLGVR